MWIYGYDNNTLRFYRVLFFAEAYCRLQHEPFEFIRFFGPLVMHNFSMRAPNRLVKSPQRNHTEFVSMQGDFNHHFNHRRLKHLFSIFFILLRNSLPIFKCRHGCFWSNWIIMCHVYFGGRKVFWRTQFEFFYKYTKFKYFIRLPPVNKIFSKQIGKRTKWWGRKRTHFLSWLIFFRGNKSPVYGKSFQGEKKSEY